VNGKAPPCLSPEDAAINLASIPLQVVPGAGSFLSNGCWGVDLGTREGDPGE